MIKRKGPVEKKPCDNLNGRQTRKDSKKTEYLSMIQKNNQKLWGRGKASQADVADAEPGSSGFCLVPS